MSTELAGFDLTSVQAIALVDPPWVCFGSVNYHPCD